MFDPITSIRSGYVCLTGADIDTDQICPARFMTTTTAEGLGDALFHDARRDQTGALDVNHPLNAARIEEQQILIGGPNFGSGSSREHAVWAIKDFGFKAVLAPKLADIFRSNALNNGLLAIEIPDPLFRLLVSNQFQIMIDLPRQQIMSEAFADTGFEITSFAKLCLLKGMDRLGFLENNIAVTQEYEDRLGL